MAAVSVVYFFQDWLVLNSFTGINNHFYSSLYEKSNQLICHIFLLFLSLLSLHSLGFCLVFLAAAITKPGF